MSKLISAIIISTIFLGGCSLVPTINNDNKSTGPSAKLILPEIIIGDDKLLVEVAKTDAERARGLSGRSFMPADQGMIFIFDKAGRYNFWMKDMAFPLDFIWIDNNTVVEITTSVPPPTPQNPVPVSLAPELPASYVVEVNAGWIADHGVTVGQGVMGLTGL